MQQLDDDEGGGGASSNHFRKFVQEHLKSFLKPIAEHVEELRNEVSDMRSQQRSLQNQLGDRITTCEAKLRTLGQSVTNFLSDQDKENSNRGHQCETFNRRLTAAEATCQEMSLASQRTAVRLDTHSNGIEDLKQSLDNSNSHMHRLQLKHWQTQGLAQQCESALAEAKDEHLALSERTNCLARNVAQTQLGAENQRIALGALNSKLEGTEKRIIDQVNSVGNHVVVLDRSIAKVKEVQLEQGKEVVPMAAELRRISHAISRLEDEVEHGMQAEDSETTGFEHLPPVHHSGSSRPDVDHALQEIRQIANNGGDKKFQETVHACVNRVKKISDELAEVVPLVRGNCVSVTSHQEHLNEMDARVRDHENRHGMTMERLCRAEGDVTNLKAGLHDQQSQMRSLASEQEKAASNQNRMLKDMSEAQTTLRAHASDMKNSDSSFVALQNRVETAYDYLHGLGKGFQDTHRSILQGHDGLLGPRPTSAQAKTGLPQLAVAPRNNARVTEFVRPGTSPPTFQLKSAKATQ